MSTITIHVPYKRDFEPIVLHMENIAIPKGNGEYEYFEVEYIEPVQPISIPFRLVPNGSVTRKLSEIELHDNMAGQWRMKLDGPIEVYMNYPRATAKWSTKNVNTSISITNTEFADDGFVEFFTYKDDVPTITVKNITGDPVYSKIVVYGFKYVLRKLKSRPSTFTVIPVYSAEYVAGGV